MQFVETTALHKIIALNKRIRFVSGGTSSSKTISIVMWLIDYAQAHENKTISVVSETVPHLKKGSIRDFLNIMIDRGYFRRERWNKTDLIYTFETGSILEFFGADQPAKVRGPRRNVLYINESNNVGYDVYTQLEIRTDEIIWLDSNPTHEYWIYTEVMPNNEIDFITLTYKDNEGLAQTIIDSIESRKGNKNWYAIYGLGELAEAEGVIYKGWKVIDEIPHEARLVRRGLDFGYTNDPTAIVAIYYYNGGYILHQEMFRRGMKNPDIATFINNQIEPQALVVADSAEPKSIDEVRDYGVSIVGANKGPGSIKHGIDKVLSQRISITKRSTDLIKEYRNYMWKTNKDGNIINEPEDLFNHTMDAIRYAIENLHPDETEDNEISTGNVENLIY